MAFGQVTPPGSSACETEAYAGRKFCFLAYTGARRKHWHHNYDILIYLTPALVIAKPLVKLGRRGRFTCRHRSHRLVMELPHGRVGLVEDKHVQPDRGGKREGPAVLPGFVYIRWNVLISPLSPFVRRQLFEPLMVEQKRFRRWGQPNASLLKIASTLGKVGPAAPRNAWTLLSGVIPHEFEHPASGVLRLPASAPRDVALANAGVGASVLKRHIGHNSGFSWQVNASPSALAPVVPRPRFATVDLRSDLHCHCVAVGRDRTCIRGLLTALGVKAPCSSPSQFEPSVMHVRLQRLSRPLLHDSKALEVRGYTRRP